MSGGGLSELQVLNLIAPPEVAEALAEWLLEREDVPGFTSMPVSGHGSSERSMTLAEQVAGRSRRVLFLIQVPRETARAIVDDLGRTFRGAGLHYWLLPVIEGGHLG
jgi:nitrogen regulatory protein PII